MVKEKYVPALREKDVAAGVESERHRVSEPVAEGLLAEYPGPKNRVYAAVEPALRKSRGQGLHVFQPAVPESVGRGYGRAPR